MNKKIIDVPILKDSEIEKNSIKLLTDFYDNNFIEAPKSHF